MGKAERATHRKGKTQMATTSKKVKQDTTFSPVSSPAITSAWSHLVVVSTTGEQEAIRATLDLAREMKKSTLSIRDIMKAIKETGLESPLVKVSHVEGLVTMLNLQKTAGFSTLPLSKQLSQATAAYKLLGAGNAEQLPSLEAIEKAVTEARKAKNEKSKEEKPAKPAKAKATTADTLKQIRDFIGALDFENVTENEADIVTEIYTIIEAKTLALV